MSRIRKAAGACVGLMLLGATSFAFVFGYDYLTQCEYFRARAIEISGHAHLSEQVVRDQARLADGVNILSVNLYLVRKRLLAHPWIADAEVSRELPDAIAIRISEHRPLAVLDLGRKFLLNENGEVFKEREGGDPAGLPLVAGLTFTDIELPDNPGSVAYRAVMEALSLSRRPDSALPIERVRRIEVDRELGLTLYAFDRAKTIKIGFNDYPDKYERLRAVLVFMARDSRVPEYTAIDLNHRNRIVVTPARIDDSERDQEEV